MKNHLQKQYQNSYNKGGLEIPYKTCSYAKIAQKFNHFQSKWLGRDSYTIPICRKDYLHLSFMMISTTQPPFQNIKRKLGCVVKTSTTAIAMSSITVSDCFSPLFNHNRGTRNA